MRCCGIISVAAGFAVAAAESYVGCQGDVEREAEAVAVQEGYDGFGACLDGTDAGLEFGDCVAEDGCFLV